MSRVCRRVRETLETRVEVELNIDEAGTVNVETPVPFLNHLLATMLTYMESSATMVAVEKAKCDDHHVAEDCGITLGEALSTCLGDRVGVRRFSHAVVPMDEALVLVAVDLSGRGQAHIELPVSGTAVVGGLSVESAVHMLEALAYRGGVTIHVVGLRGRNAHHVLEAAFKGLGMALHEATRIVGAKVRSLKGVL